VSRGREEVAGVGISLDVGGRHRAQRLDQRPRHPRIVPGDVQLDRQLGPDVHPERSGRDEPVHQEEPPSPRAGERQIHRRGGAHREAGVDRLGGQVLDRGHRPPAQLGYAERVPLGDAVFERIEDPPVVQIGGVDPMAVGAQRVGPGVDRRAQAQGGVEQDDVAHSRPPRGR